MQTPPVGRFTEGLFGSAQAPPLGTRPARAPKPTYRPDAPCYKQALPDLNGPASAKSAEQARAGARIGPPPSRSGG